MESVGTQAMKVVIRLCIGIGAVHEVRVAMRYECSDTF